MRSRPQSLSAGQISALPVLAANDVVALRSSDRLLYASTLWQLASEGHRVITFSPDQQPPDLATVLFDLSVEGPVPSMTRLRTSPRRRAGDFEWAVATATSGSLSAPRYFGYRLEDMIGIASHYQKLYGISRDSLVVTALPPWYNFTIVAGVALSALSGARLLLPEDLVELRPEETRDADRTVILGNPVTLLSSPRVVDVVLRTPGVLVDSGGAPLGVEHLRAFRRSGLDVREGYGLTETLSLTHFDSEGTDASIGTVGRCLEFAEQRISNGGRLEIRSKFSARPILSQGAGDRDSDWLDTRDMVSIDSAGRLRILGRVDDVAIGGLWPKDTLDVLSGIFPSLTMLVQHPTSDSARVVVRGRLSRLERGEMRDAVRSYLGLPGERIAIVGATKLLASKKLPRAVSEAAEDYPAPDGGNAGRQRRGG